MAKEKEYFPENKKNKLITSISEAERQRNAVRAMYEGTEKWLKAPNGKPTNLTKEQWITVHTPNFKRWFGNWDYDENKKLKTVELDKNEVKFNHNNASEVEKWLKENLSGKSVVIDSSGAKVLFFNKGLTDSLKRHGEVQRNAYTVMEDLISKSEFFDFIKTDGQKKHNGISGQDIYYSVLKVDDRYYSVQFKFNVSEKYRTDSYKDHKITEIKATPLLYRGSKDAHAITDAASYDFTISQLTGGVKPSFSQVINENGEPLVVYHGSRTGGGFDVFDGSTFHAKNYESADIFKQEADFVIQINGDRKISLDKWQAENLAYNLTGGDYEITEIATWKDLTDILKDTSDENKQYLQELVFDDFGIDVNDIERLTISENNIYQDFVNLRNPLVIDFNNEVWGQQRTVEQYFDKARENEHDGLLVKNIIEGGLTAETRNGENPIATTDYVTFSPNQIKSATDNNGNFDINNESILFQVIGEHRDQSNEKRNVALEQTYTQGDKTMPGEQKDLYISEEQALRIQLAREIKQNMPNLTDGERAAAIAILEAGAASQKMSLTDYVQQTFPNGVFGDYEKAQNAAHQQGVEINGAVSVSGFGANARAVIYASKTADFSTWCHELSHIWQAQLTGTLKSDAEKAFQVQNGNWQESIYTFADGHTDTSAEAFAYGFEDFLKHKAGEMATKDKKTIFEKFADYMSRTYNGVKQNIEMSEEIAKVYEQFVQLDDNILAEAEKAVQMEKDLSDSAKNINELLNSSDLRSSKKVSKTIGYVSPRFSNLAKQYGYDIKGYRHTIDNFFINHANNRHSTARTEAARGNVAITTNDILNIAQVYESPDYIIFGTKTKTGNPAIVYAKNMGNATVFVEDVRSGKKELAAETLYKKSGAIDVSSKKEAPELYAHSDPESISIIDVKKEFVNEIENGELIFQAAYHGSGASFDHFNTTQYGLSGEGSMAFGWGTYLTSSEDIARDYADRQGSQKYADINDSYNVLKTNVFGTLRNAAEMKGFEKAVQERKAALQHQVEDTDGFYSDEQKRNAKRLLEEMENLTENDLKTRHIYSVEIPDGKYLSWNNDVPEATKTEIAEKLHSHLVESDPESYSGNAANYLRQELESLFESEMDGQRFYGSLADYLGSERQASEFLKESGYTGISYPAGTIYGNGNGATNYVIFNDDDIEIKEHLQFQLVGERSIMRMAETQQSQKSINIQGEKNMAQEKQIIAEIGFADGEIKQYDDAREFLNDLAAASRENAHDTTFRVYAESDELKRRASDVKLDNYDPMESAERMYNGYEWNDVEHEAVQFNQSAEGRRLLKESENGRLTILDARDILDAVEKNGMTLRYDPLPNSYVVDGWTAADGEKLDNYVVSMSELKRLAGIEISENSRQNQIQEKKTARTPEEEQAYQEWLEMLEDNQQAEDRMERMQGVPPEEQKPLPEWQQRLNATINQAAEMDGVKNSIKAALYDNAEKFTDVPFSREGYERLFQDGVVQSPLETIHFADNQFDVKDQEKFMLAAYQTLSNPDLIYAESENKDNLESRNYVKTFVFGDDEKSALDIVVKTIDGQKVMISAQKRSLEDLIDRIKQPDQLVYMSEEIKQAIDRRSPEEKQRLKDVLPKLRIVPENTAYDKEKAIATARNFAAEKRNVALEAEQKPEHNSSSREREAYDRKYPTDWQIYTKELTDKLNAVSKEIENYLKYGTLPENSRFILPNSPQFLQKIGSHDTQISLPVAVVKKAHETHGLTLTEIQDAVKKLYNPVLAFDSDKSKSENKADSRLLLTDSFTKENKPVALAINVNSNVKLIDSNISAEVQDIRSIHDRTLIAKNGTDLIKKWTQDGLCRYVDDKKISDWSSLARVYFPIELLQSPKNNILTKTEIVNSLGKDFRNPATKEISQTEKNFSPKKYLKYHSELFLKHLDQGKLPFLQGEEIGDNIIIKMKAVRNAVTGRALTGYQQLLAQDIINTMVGKGELSRMEYELVTYEQAKEAGTFIKKGAPHFILPVYNEKTNSIFNQIYYFKSGCKEPEKIELANDKVRREAYIKRLRVRLSNAEKERMLTQNEKDELYNMIANAHQAILVYMEAMHQNVSVYRSSLPKHEQEALRKVEELEKNKEKKTKEERLQELIKESMERRHRMEDEEARRQEEKPIYFDARKTASYESYLGTVMAAATVDGNVVASKDVINTVVQTLTPVMRQAFNQFDYMKGFDIGKIMNSKCKENLRDYRRNSIDNLQKSQAMEKVLAFQQGGQMSPPDRNAVEVETYGM